MTTIATPENKLSKDEVQRINSCNDYKYIKNTLATVEAYKSFEVGAAVFIKNNRNKAYLTGPNRSTNPSKYIIIHNDNGFIFAKRIIQSGEPGTIVQCLTIEYPIDKYTLELDEEMVDAMLLDEVYDPTAAAKEYKSKKNKATRINNKKRLKFDTPLEAHAYLKSLTVGTRLWESWTTYGEDATELLVKEIKITPCINLSPPLNADHVARHNYEKHKQVGLIEVITITLERFINNNGYAQDKNIYFYHLINGKKYRYSNIIFYDEKPLTPGDIL